MSETSVKDYSLIGESAQSAVEKGLAEADWYTSPVSRADMKSLLTRRDWPAIRDTILWFALLIGLRDLGIRMVGLFEGNYSFRFVWVNIRV